MSDEPKIKIFMNSNAKMSRGKYAAHAVHAALIAAGVHPGLPVVVLGSKPTDIEQMKTVVHDAGLTEIAPGTVTAGTDWTPKGSNVGRGETITLRERLKAVWLILTATPVEVTITMQGYEETQS